MADVLDKYEEIRCGISRCNRCNILIALSETPIGWGYSILPWCTKKTASHTSRLSREGVKYIPRGQCPGLRSEAYSKDIAVLVPTSADTTSGIAVCGVALDFKGLTGDVVGAARENIKCARLILSADHNPNDKVKVITILQLEVHALIFRDREFCAIIRVPRLCPPTKREIYITCGYPQTACYLFMWGSTISHSVSILKSCP